MTFTIRPRSLLIVAAIAALGIAAGVAYAAIPDSAGVIRGCYDKNGGLRVIDPSTGSACKNSETALDWSQTGPQGMPGQDGTNGTNGTNGVSGWELKKADFPLPSEGDGYSGTAQSDEVSCSPGKKILGGGITTDSWVNSIVRYSGPNASGTKWMVIIQRTNDGDSPDKSTTQAHLYAICATAN
jgi:hypothetical protein